MPNNPLAEPLRQLNSFIPGPLDGWLTGLAVWFLSPPQDRMRNTLVAGAIHFTVHESICDTAAPSVTTVS